MAPLNVLQISDLHLTAPGKVLFDRDGDATLQAVLDDVAGVALAFEGELGSPARSTSYAARRCRSSA